METRDSYHAMSGDKLPLVFNSSRINLRASNVYLIYVCDLPAGVQHCLFVPMLMAPPFALAVQLPQFVPCWRRHMYIRYFYDWFEHNGVKINTEKTQIMITVQSPKSYQED